MAYSDQRNGRWNLGPVHSTTQEIFVPYCASSTKQATLEFPYKLMFWLVFKTNEMSVTSVSTEPFAPIVLLASHSRRSLGRVYLQPQKSLRDARACGNKLNDVRWLVLSSCTLVVRTRFRVKFSYFFLFTVVFHYPGGTRACRVKPQHDCNV